MGRSAREVSLAVLAARRVAITASSYGRGDPSSAQETIQTDLQEHQRIEGRTAGEMPVIGRWKNGRLGGLDEMKAPQSRMLRITAESKAGTIVCW